jgi:hypothetical protein
MANSFEQSSTEFSLTPSTPYGSPEVFATEWRTWAIDDSLKKTDTYEILYDEMEEVVFASPKDLCNFIKYCEYMMFASFREPHPIPEEECCDYFRSLYKYVEMVYEENILEARQQILSKNQ